MPETRSDIGEETARFQAFKDRNDDLPPAWQMRAPGSKVALLAVIVIIAAILALVIALLLAA